MQIKVDINGSDDGIKALHLVIQSSEPIKKYRFLSQYLRESVDVRALIFLTLKQVLTS